MQLSDLPSIAPVLYELRKTLELDLCFVDGPTRAPAVMGIAELYEGPFYRFYDEDAPHLARIVEGLVKVDPEEGSTPEEYMRKLRQHGLLDLSPTRACDFVEKYAAQWEEGFFDGILGFSEGASVAASLLFRQAAQKVKSQFKFAIFLCGLTPQSEDSGAILADRFSARISIPTAHILGSRDPLYQASLTLFNLCDGQSSRMYDHGKGHTIPWDSRATQAIAYEIQQVIHLGLESSNSVP